MKKRYKFIAFIGVIFSMFACHNESSLTPEYKFDGPVPAIADGPSEAQKICYELYKKYDLHVYYTLEGEDALQTILGKVYASVFSGTEGAYPVQAGDEITSTAFLKWMKKFYETLPEKMAKNSVKRQVLVKVGTMYDFVGYMLEAYLGEDVDGGIFSIGISTEAQKGVIYWGDMNDDMGIQPEVWKYSLCCAYFEARVSNYNYPELPVVKDLIKVSSGKYLASLLFNGDWDSLMDAVDWDTMSLNMDNLMGNGFVSGDGWNSVRNDTGVEEGNEYLDLVSYMTWIACTPLDERQDILGSYPLVKQKYDITIAYCKKYLDFDLEAFSSEWSKVTVDEN